MRFFRAVVGFFLATCTVAAFAQARELPDFTRLVEEQGAAVVNIGPQPNIEPQLIPSF